LLLLMFFTWCPWPAVAYSHKHLNLSSFYPSIAADTSKYQQDDARCIQLAKIKQQAPRQHARPMPSGFYNRLNRNRTRL
jgi:hypothetical protein